MINTLKSFLIHPLARDLDIDSPETTMHRSRIIREKSFLKQLYETWYASVSKALPEDITGPVVELGSGGGFLKEIIPGIITSEILQIFDIDMVLDGHRLPFKKESLKGLVMVDVFHHLPRVRHFLSEAAYCMKPGGVIVMIEPWNTPWAARIYSHLHHEPFEPNAPEWELPKGGPLSQANSALPWIVFERDLEKFRAAFPEWHLKEPELHTPFSYLLSGGVSLRNFMPGYLFRICRQAEEKLIQRKDRWAMFAKLVLVKKRIQKF